LSARGGEGACHVVHFALWILQTHDEHVLREPAFRARLPAGDAQRMAFFPQKSITAVTRAEALDRELFREVHDETTLGIQFPDRMQATNERTILRNTLERRASHARHNDHVENDIGAVGDLDTTAGKR